MTGESNWMTGEIRTWSCPDPYGSPVASSWRWDGTSGYFVDNGTCTESGPSSPPPPPACTAPATQTTPITRPVADESRDAECPAGYLGTHYQTRSREERGQLEESWSCPSPTGSPVSSTRQVWFGTYDYGAWISHNDCTPPPVEEPPAHDPWTPPPPPPPNGSDTGHCGIPADHYPNNSPDWLPVNGGWMFVGSGEASHFLDCP